MFYLLLIFYTLLLGILAWRRFDWAIYYFVLILPTYLIRFNIGQLPSTLLELSFGALFLVWLLRFAWQDRVGLMLFVRTNKFFCSSVLVFLCSSVAGILVSDMWYYSLGQWRAYFLEPMLFFVVIVGRARPLPALSLKERGTIDLKSLILALVVGTIPVSLVAILQKFFPVLYPPVLWDDETFGRVTSFFTTPNAIPLFILPTLFLGLPLASGEWGVERNKFTKKYRNSYFLALAIGLAALILSKSFGGFFAFGVGVLLLVHFYYIENLKVSVILAGLAILFATTLPLPQIKTASLQNRYTLWKHSITYLTESPKNFIFGAGIRQYFRKVEKPYYNPKELERLIYPHNIILNFWTEIGMFGMLAFLGMIASLMLGAYRLAMQNRNLGFSLLAALAVFFVHGLVDVPYFKNDLAFLFWVWAAIIISAQHSSVIPTEARNERNGGIPLSRI